MAVREFIRRNFWQKLWSLVLATRIWLTVRFGDPGFGFSQFFGGDVTRSFQGVPVSVLTEAADTGRFRASPSAVDVVVRGPRSRLRDLRGRDIDAYVNLLDPQESQLSRARVRVRVPDGLRIDSLSPSNVLIEKLP